MIEEDDWRLRGDPDPLQGRLFRWATWWSSGPGWDHDHCDYCGAGISNLPGDDYDSAWVTADDNYYWVCPVCFEDFRERFGFQVVE